LCTELIVAQHNSEQFVYIKGGFYQPGTNEGDSDAKPVKKFFIRSFWISKKEVSNAKYAEFLNIKGNQVVGHCYYIYLSGKWRDQKCRILYKDSVYSVEQGFENYPVNFVSYYGAEAYCQFVGGRLPTETEWELAASKNRMNQADLSDFAWFRDNSEKQIHQSALLKADTSGIFDLFGNLAEWCSDNYSPTSYSEMKFINPKSLRESSFKVHRGGSWADSKEACTPYNRRASNPEEYNSTIGFRVVYDKSKFKKQRPAF
jgi:formylglycine-generating enzyme required for sulfatase activity